MTESFSFALMASIRKMQGIGKSADEIATEICSHAIGLGYILPGSDADPKVLADFIHMYYDAISGNT